MRTFSFLVVLALLVACTSALRFDSSPNPANVPVPYKSCGSSSDDATLTSIVSNEFPPVKGDTLTLNVTGNLTKQVTSGTYTISISVSGFPLPDITGDIADFRPLPWPVGELNFTYAQEIPSAAPAGSYVVKISAVDQDSARIFCLSIAFSLSASTDELAIAAPATKQQVRDSSVEPQLKALSSLFKLGAGLTTESNTNNVQPLPAIRSIPKMQPISKRYNKKKL